MGFQVQKAQENSQLRAQKQRDGSWISKVWEALDVQVCDSVLWHLPSKQRISFSTKLSKLQQKTITFPDPRCDHKIRAFVEYHSVRCFYSWPYPTYSWIASQIYHSCSLLLKLWLHVKGASNVAGRLVAKPVGVPLWKFQGADGCNMGGLAGWWDTIFGNGIFFASKEMTLSQKKEIFFLISKKTPANPLPMRKPLWSEETWKQFQQFSFWTTWFVTCLFLTKARS